MFYGLDEIIESVYVVKCFLYLTNNRTKVILELVLCKHLIAYYRNEVKEHNIIPFKCLFRPLSLQTHSLRVLIEIGAVIALSPKYVN